MTPEPRRRLSVYQRITMAAERRTGLRLSYDDVFALSRDDTIQRLAENDDENPRFRTRTGLEGTYR